MKDKKIAWFSALTNVVPAEYEKWLEDLASQGWQVDRIGQWSSLRMTFKREEPKQYRYVYDMQLNPKKDYKTTYQQFGWEFVGQMASAYIWRKEYSQERPESFSDRESLEKRNKRVIGAASVSFYMFSLMALAITVCFILFFNRLDADDIFQFILGMVLTYAIASYMGYVMKQLYKNRTK